MCPAKASKRIFSSVTITWKAGRNMTFPNSCWWPSTGEFPAASREREEGLPQTQCLRQQSNVGTKYPVIFYEQRALLYVYCKTDAVGASCHIIHVLPLISGFISPECSSLDVQYQQAISFYCIIPGEYCAPGKDNSCIHSGFPEEITCR